MRSRRIQLRRGDIHALVVVTRHDGVVLAVFDEEGEPPLIQAILDPREAAELRRALDARPDA